MSLNTAIIDLDSLQIQDPPFQPEAKAIEIEALAHTIVNLRGLVNIPVVQLQGFEDYILISGHLEYYAYLKARELDDELPERLTVFIMDKKNEADIQKQLAILTAIDQASQSETSPIATIQEAHHDESIGQSVSHPAVKPLEFNNLTERVNHLSERVDRTGKSLESSLQELKTELLNAIDAKLPQPIPLLEAFNRISEGAIAAKIHKKLNTIGVKGKKAETIVQRLQAKPQEYTTFSEVLDAIGKGLISKEKMLELIDRWYD